MTFPWITVGLAAALTVSAAGLYYQTKQNGKLSATVAQQEQVIQQQALWADRLDSTLLQREVELQELQDGLMQTVEEWSRYREHMEDACTNSAHPNLHKWLRPQPNSYFDGDTAPRVPATGI